MEKKAWRGGREKRRRYASKTDGGVAKRCKQDGRTFRSVRRGEVFLQSALFPGLMDDRGGAGGSKSARADYRKMYYRKMYFRMKSRASMAMNTLIFLCFLVQRLRMT